MSASVSCLTDPVSSRPMFAPTMDSRTRAHAPRGHVHYIKYRRSLYCECPQMRHIRCFNRANYQAVKVERLFGSPRETIVLSLTVFPSGRFPRRCASSRPTRRCRSPRPRRRGRPRSLPRRVRCARAPRPPNRTSASRFRSPTRRT